MCKKVVVISEGKLDLVEVEGRVNFIFSSWEENKMSSIYPYDGFVIDLSEMDYSRMANANKELVEQLLVDLKGEMSQELSPLVVVIIPSNHSNIARGRNPDIFSALTEERVAKNIVRIIFPTIKNSAHRAELIRRVFELPI